MPVYGTCAGLIMLADTVLDAIAGQQTPRRPRRRRAPQRVRLAELDSFETDLDIPELGDPPVHAVFIRGPVVESVGPAATALAALADGRVVAVEQGNLLGTCFHPEITGDYRFHEYFLRRVAEA